MVSGRDGVYRLVCSGVGAGQIAEDGMYIDAIGRLGSVEGAPTVVVGKEFHLSTVEIGRGGSGTQDGIDPWSIVGVGREIVGDGDVLSSLVDLAGHPLLPPEIG